MATHITEALYISGGLSSSTDFNANNPVIGYQNLVEVGGITSDSAETDYPVTNLGNDSTAEYWESASDALQYVTFVLGTAQAVDYIGVGAHNLVGATYEFQYKVTAGGTWTAVDTPLTPNDNSAIMWLFDSITADYWRIKITPVTGTNPKIGVVYIGQRLQLQRRIYVGHTPIVYGRNTSIQTGMSESGNFLGRVLKREQLESSFEQENVSPSFYRDSVDAFVIHAKTKPWFFSWRPSQYPVEVGFCWSTGDIVPSNQRTNGMMSFSVKYGAHAPWT